MTSVCLTERRDDTWRRRSCEAQSRNKSYAATTKEYLQPPESGRNLEESKKESPIKPQGMNRGVQISI